MAAYETRTNNSSDLEHEAIPTSPGEIVLASITGIDGTGQPLVEFDGYASGEPIPALSTVPVTRNEVGRTVALLFAKGDHNRPVIMGLIHNPLHSVIEKTLAQSESEVGAPEPDTRGTLAAADEQQAVLVDGERVVIEGKKEIVLRCGEASITLTSAGKVLIRGKYLLNRSSGVNRILGGSVQVN